MTQRGKLYVVVAGCLEPGLQLTQAMHAARLFAEEHPALERAWFEQSNTLAVLSVPDGAGLARLCIAAEAVGVAYSVFHEPDILALAPGYDRTYTAVAFEPSQDARRLCRSLPRALKEVRAA